jgi:phosphatidate cytidylyltransferase
MIWLSPLLAEKFSWPYAILFGATISILSFLGDLSESLIKRQCQIKDSAHLIPEFGGILDLVDSLVFTAPWGYYFLFALLKS